MSNDGSRMLNGEGRGLSCGKMPFSPFGCRGVQGWLLGGPHSDVGGYGVGEICWHGGEGEAKDGV